MLFIPSYMILYYRPLLWKAGSWYSYIHYTNSSSWTPGMLLETFSMRSIYFPYHGQIGNIFTCFRKDVCFFRISRGYSYSHLVCNFLITCFSSLQPLQDVRNCLRCWRSLLQLLLVFPLFNPYKILEIA